MNMYIYVSFLVLWQILMKRDVLYLYYAGNKAI
jgi:hypothetical protein